MEKLRVENFLVINQAELDLRQFCVIIGPQASGKSVLAKLVHLFREFFGDTTRDIVLERREEHAEDLKSFMGAVLLKSLSEYFPGVLRNGQGFRIEYTTEEFSAHIEGNDVALENRQFNVEFSDKYLEFLAGIARELANARKLATDKIPLPPQDVDEQLKVLLETSPVADSFRQARKDSLFIPASRAFFATLQKHIFTMLKSGISLDPLMTAFGSKFEVSRDIYERQLSGLHELADPRVQSILVGKYRYSEGDDWIYGPDGRVKLQYASSGQQEALPLLLVLTVWGGFMPGGSFIIEEPEAHLYPQAQKDIVSLLGLISNQRQLDFFITTHSPYILAALNNLILAGEVKEAVGTDVLADVVTPETSIHFSDVSAYTLSDGVLQTILDEESRLIGVNAIDGVSDEFSQEFEALLELREAGERGAYTG